MRPSLMGESQLQKVAVLVVISDDVASSLGADGGGPTTRESRGGETARPVEKRQLANDVWRHYNNVNAYS